jgi:hypothetical protein
MGCCRIELAAVRGALGAMPFGYCTLRPLYERRLVQCPSVIAPYDRCTRGAWCNALRLLHPTTAVRGVLGAMLFGYCSLRPLYEGCLVQCPSVIAPCDLNHVGCNNQRALHRMSRWRSPRPLITTRTTGTPAAPPPSIGGPDRHRSRRTSPGCAWEQPQSQKYSNSTHSLPILSASACFKPSAGTTFHSSASRNSQAAPACV